LAHLGERYDLPRANLLGAALDEATTQYLLNSKAPSRKVNEHDNRGTHFYVAMYWAQALAEQSDDAALSAHFAPLAAALAENEATINAELLAVQGQAMDIGGYYQPDTTLAASAMRPSQTFNALIDGA
jgi:isocitrate dehydrogenase